MAHNSASDNEITLYVHVTNHQLRLKLCTARLAQEGLPVPPKQIQTRHD